MAQSPPISASDYYDFFPPPEHRVGDIWVDLPTFGMFGVAYVTGIVITPACDLQNCKAETITYLPIVSIRQAFVLRGLLPTVTKAINGQVQILGIEGVDDSAGPFVLPDKAAVDGLVARIEDKVKGGRVGERERLAVARAMAGVAILKKSYGPSIGSASGEELQNLFGSNTDSIERLLRNSRADMHFLPKDKQRSEWAAIREPSVALFRYVFSAPIEVFDVAQDTSRLDWEREVSLIAANLGGASAFAGRRPMKRQTLKPRFAADLLTRYVAMHVRLGAPDFTDASIDSYVADVMEINK